MYVSCRMILLATTLAAMNPRPMLHVATPHTQQQQQKKKKKKKKKNFKVLTQLTTTVEGSLSLSLSLPANTKTKCMFFPSRLDTCEV
jgi:hypothetical protein